MKAIFIRSRGLKLLLLCLPLLYACGSRETDSPLPQEPEANMAAAPLLTVVDSIGHELTVPREIRRIACLYAFTCHVTTMLDRGGDIVAVVNGSKRDLLLNEVNPAIRLAGTPSAEGIINIEELLKLEPDIVFLKGETAGLESEIEKLERFSLPWAAIDYRSIKEQMEAIEIMGKILGRSEKARAYNDYYRESIRFTEERLEDLPREERIRVYHSVNEATRTDAPGTLEAEWTEIAGTMNVSVGEPLRFFDNKHFASLEQIFLWNPEVILVNQEGVDRYMLTNEKWAALPAVRAERVYQIPVGISRWGHPGGMETPLAIIWTAKKLYPERFRDVNLEEMVRNFYSTFFGIELTEEMTAQILSGRGMRLQKGLQGEGEKTNE